MSVLFPKKQPAGERIVLLLDIENGSVGAGLVRLSPLHAPKLFGEVRKHTRIPKTHDSELLAKEVEKAAGEALAHIQEVAGRVRLHAQLAPLGKIERGAVFLRAPWVHVDFNDAGRPETSAVDTFLDSVKQLGGSILGDLPTSFHSFGVSAGPILHSLFDIEDRSVICMLGGEVTELFVTDSTGVHGYATIPLGTHTVIRTLQTHNGLSEAEVYSLLRLPRSASTETLHTSASHMLGEFMSVLRALLYKDPSKHVFVVGEEPFTEWLAQVLAHKDLGDIFTERGEVRTVGRHHVAPYLAGHAEKPDIPLMLLSLFADARFGAYN